MSRKKLTKKFSYSTDKATYSFDLPIGLSVDFKIFFSMDDIPECLRKHITGYRRVYFDDFYSLERTIDAGIEAYEATFVEETKERVIVYFYYHGESRGRCDLSHFLDLGYKVVWEFRSGNDIKYLNERGDELHKSDLVGHEWREVKIQTLAWTQEREDWFKGVIGQVESLARVIKKGIGSAPGVLARKIEQNIQLRLEGGKGE